MASITFTMEPDVPVATPRFTVNWPHPTPENQDVDDVVTTTWKLMRSILMDSRNADDAPLKPEDEAKVRSVLKHHPKAEEKTGSGIDYIKIKKHSTFKNSRCFWVVRTDGTEVDFSYHKCLQGKAATECPDLLPQYDSLYKTYKFREPDMQRNRSYHRF